MVAYYEDQVGAPPCTTCYLSLDHLGSTRMVTDQNQNVVSRHDFMPFGYELGSGYAGRGSLWGALDPVRQKYTGDEQDNQDLSFFQARYYLLPQGRFNSPDPVNFGADILNPQSWNGYSYVMNSPLSSVDPDGLGTICNICSTGLEEALRRRLFQRTREKALIASSWARAISARGSFLPARSDEPWANTYPASTKTATRSIIKKEKAPEGAPSSRPIYVGSRDGKAIIAH